jgi:2-polyprenyl-3-methyl-5-hydroxy-6-metoxy-1,4-benzoquinol methylase
VIGTTEQATREDAAFRCPACGATVIPTPDGHLCEGCGRRYERRLRGIVDLRLSYPDPQLSLDEDANLARSLAAVSRDRDLAGLLGEHWRLVGKHSELASRFTAQELKARSKSPPIVDAIETALGRAIGPEDRVLEIGCGTAALAATLARRGAGVVASDVSLRWLVLAQKRLAEEATERVELVACAAEAVPFPDESFDVVAASDVIEHVEDAQRFVAECARVLRPGGLLFLATPNRYSLGLEPHVRLWGVGFVPRRLAEPYVRALRKTSYSHVRLFSARSLGRLLTRNGLDASIVPPQVPTASLELYRGIELLLARAYNHLRTRAVTQPFLLAVGPFFHVFARKAPRAPDVSADGR